VCRTWAQPGRWVRARRRHDADLAYGALVLAVAIRGGAVPGAVFRTDQGSAYTAEIPAGLQGLGIAQSMRRPGSSLWTTR
jgi:putative transposase